MQSTENYVNNLVGSLWASKCRSWTKKQALKGIEQPIRQNILVDYNVHNHESSCSTSGYFTNILEVIIAVATRKVVEQFISLDKNNFFYNRDKVSPFSVFNNYFSRLLNLKTS